MRESSPAVAAQARRDLPLLALVLLVALAVRAFLAFRGQVIFNDGPRFIDIARAFVAGDTAHALTHAYHPLYSWLTAQAYPLFGDYERAGLAVSVLAGTLVGLPLWALLNGMFGRRVAWAGLVLWAVHPFATDYAANVQSDSLYLFFFLTAVWALWTGLEALPHAGAFGRFALAGAASGLAYLTRPEGAGVVVLGGLWLVLALRRLPQARHLREISARLLAGALLMACFVVPTYFYLKNIHDTTGMWQLTRKKSLTQLVSGRAKERPEWAKDTVKDEVIEEFGRPPIRKETKFEVYVVRGARIFRTFSEALTWLLVPFLVLGLLVRGRALLRTRSDLYLLSFFGLYGFTLYRLAVTLGYAGKRHVFPLVLLALGWTGLGVVALSRRLEIALRARGSGWAKRSGAVLLTVLVVASLPKTLRTNVHEPLGEKQAGFWIREHTPVGSTARVFAPRDRILYYADADNVRVPLRFNYDAAIAYLRRYGADFVVTSDSMTDLVYPRFLERIGPEDLRREVEFPEREGSRQHYTVYRVLYPEGRPASVLSLPRTMKSWGRR